MNTFKNILGRSLYVVLGVLLAVQCTPVKKEESIEFVVVTRTKTEVVEKEVVKIKYVTKNVCDKSEDPVYIERKSNLSKKNSVMLHAGSGPIGNEVSGSFNKLRVGLNYGAVGGMSYIRDLSDNVNASASAYSNHTYMLGLGVKW